MIYGSVCSGIEAATVAWHHMGWQPEYFSEIEPFPSAVLAHHYPNTPNLGDMTKFSEWNHGSIDLIVGGTPCQSFSVAGLRKGLDDPRGNLMLTYLAITSRARPRWLVWENVPGVLSSNGGRDFGALLGGLAKLGYGFAHRVLDAQYFGVAQRRRRVFVVGHLGDWRRAAAVLFERYSLSGHPEPSREARQKVAGNSTGGAKVRSHWDGELNPHPTLSQSHNTGGIGQSNQELFSQRGAGLVSGYRMTAFGIPGNWIGRAPENGGNAVEPMNNVSPCLTRTDRHGVAAKQVRRLTPIECERLQGFPDNYTTIPWRNKGADNCPDGPRYKALGNSMAVPVMRWIGERINAVDKL